MKVGDVIRVKAHKADGMCYQSWDATVVELDDHHVILFTPKGAPIDDAFKGPQHSDFNDRATYWFDKPYTFIEGFDDGGRLIELYLDICAPPRIAGDELHYVDHELDVVREMPAPAYLMDEDEFAEAVQTYAYTSEFQTWCYDAARQAMDFANTVEPSIIRLP